jgi:hypothetical protein
MACNRAAGSVTRCLLEINKKNDAEAALRISAALP